MRRNLGKWVNKEGTEGVSKRLACELYSSVGECLVECSTTEIVHVRVHIHVCICQFMRLY